MKTPLELQFENLSGELPQVRREYLAKVVRWVYSSAKIYSTLDRRINGTDDDVLPSPAGALHAAGFNALNQPILLQDYGLDYHGSRALIKTPSNQIWIEEFITHHDECLSGVRFVGEKLQEVYWRRFAGHRLLEEEMVFEGAYGRRLFHYEGTRTKLIQSLDKTGNVFREISFDAHGQQSFFRVRSNGTRFQLYQPPPKGTKVKALKDSVKERLLRLIPELIASKGISEPIYCVSLVYDDEGNDALPPMIALGLESERREWIIKHGKQARDYIWNPAEFSHFGKFDIELSDEILEEACDLLNSKYAEGQSTSPAARLLEETAAALNKVSWPTSIQRTEDFVAYSVGLEGSGLRRSLKASTTPQLFSKLKARGLI